MIKNTQGVWILYSIVLILNSLIADKQKTVAKKSGIKRRTAEISQPGYLKNALTLKWNSKKKNALLQRRGFAFISIENERGLWIHLGLTWIRVNTDSPH